MNDSSLLISVLHTFILSNGENSLSEILDFYPEVSYADAKGKERVERANKYFIMFGQSGDLKGLSLAERR